MLRDCPSIW